jgi:hypothetical protein
MPDLAILSNLLSQRIFLTRDNIENIFAAWEPCGVILLSYMVHLIEDCLELIREPLYLYYHQQREL